MRVLDIRRQGVPDPQELGSESPTSTTATVTVSKASWVLPEQSVEARGTNMSAGDAGALAVRMYGRALRKLSDS